MLRLSCVVNGPIYGRFMDCNVNGLHSIHKERNWYSSYALLDIRMLFFPGQAEYSYFLPILFLNYSLLHFRFRKYWGPIMALSINYS